MSLVNRLAHLRNRNERDHALLPVARVLQEPHHHWHGDADRSLRPEGLRQAVHRGLAFYIHFFFFPLVFVLWIDNIRFLDKTCSNFFGF